MQHEEFELNNDDISAVLVLQKVHLYLPYDLEGILEYLEFIGNLEEKSKKLNLMILYR